MEPKTKIVATLGPATANEEMIEKLICNGVNVFRVNLSHDTHERHRQTIRTVKKLDEKYKAHVAILSDLQGPKLRIGEVINDMIELHNGQEIEFTSHECIGDGNRLYMSYKEFPNDVKKGEFILIDDGKIKLEVLSTDGKESVKAKVIYGGWLSSHKGVNLPDTRISLPSLTEKDLDDARFALDEGVDWIGLSFVRNAEDLAPLKELIRQSGKAVSVIAKIEKPEAVKQIDEIIHAADGIMVARGDLGVEMSFDHVPILQKMIVKKCITQAKPVIIATQMLESMISNFRPTRAEANDVANAVMDGADAVMLSGETSIGSFPVETVQAMRKIVTYTEENGFQYGNELWLPDRNLSTFIRDSVCYNAYRMASQIKVKAIIAFTNSGYTAMRIASYRPETKIYAFTNNKSLVHKMSVLWGTKAFYYEEFGNSDEAISESIRRLKEEEILTEGDIVLHVGSTPIDRKGSANMIRVSKIF